MILPMCQAVPKAVFEVQGTHALPTRVWLNRKQGWGFLFLHMLSETGAVGNLFGTKQAEAYGLFGEIEKAKEAYHDRFSRQGEAARLF